MSNLEKAKVLLEEGWKARENLDLPTARVKLQESQRIFEEAGEFRLVTESLNHRAYTEKLDATQHAALGLELAMESERVALEHGTEVVLIYRAIMSCAETANFHELGLQYANKMLPLLKKPVLQGDLYSHIATFEMRTGNLEQANQTIEKGLALLQEGWETEREPHRTIWLLRAHMAKALITYNGGNRDGAIDILQKAKDSIQGREDLKARAQQIDLLLKYL